jgi:CRP-like cAMP-binding protein
MKEHEEPLFNYINSINPVSRDWFEELYKLIVFRNYSKEEIFIQRGQPDQHEYFLIEGVCRSYLLNTEGKEVTISFSRGVSFLSPSSIRTLNGVSLFSYQALTDIVIGSIESRSFLNLMMHISEIRSFRNAILHHELLQRVEKDVSLITLTTKERLLQFQEKYPALDNIIPHSYLASYLSIENSEMAH